MGQVFGVLDRHILALEHCMAETGEFSGRCFNGFASVARHTAYRGEITLRLKDRAVEQIGTKLTHMDNSVSAFCFFLRYSTYLNPRRC